MDLLDFEKIYNRMFNTLCNKAYRMINDADAAKDIVQNVFLRFWNMRDKLVINTTPDAYVYKAVINETLNYLDKKKRMVIVSGQNDALKIESGKTPEEELRFNELQQKINNLLSKLPPRCRKVFILSRFEDMTYKEIAAFLQISENTVDNHIKKALSYFRKALINIILFFG